MPVIQISEMGTKLDAKCHETLLRQDDEAKRKTVALARQFIYTDGRNINSEAVERILKDESLVPTTVSTIMILALYSCLQLLLHTLECLFRILY